MAGRKSGNRSASCLRSCVPEHRVAFPRETVQCVRNDDLDRFNRTLDIIAAFQRRAMISGSDSVSGHSARLIREGWGHHGDLVASAFRNVGKNSHRSCPTDPSAALPIICVALDFGCAPWQQSASRRGGRHLTSRPRRRTVQQADARRFRARCLDLADHRLQYRPMTRRHRHPTGDTHPLRPARPDRHRHPDLSSPTAAGTATPGSTARRRLRRGDGTLTYTAPARRRRRGHGRSRITQAQRRRLPGFDIDHATGDTIYIYQGACNAPTSFLYAGEFADGNTTFNGSLVNTGLTAGLNAVAIAVRQRRL